MEQQHPIPHGPPPGFIRLQVESYGLFRFITLVDPLTRVGDLKKEILELYGYELKILAIKDEFHNDLQNKFILEEICKDMDQLFIVVSVPESNPPTTATTTTTAPPPNNLTIST